MKLSLLRADKELFAVYQTIYSGADTEMWFDWERRLRDTKWTDDCFFVMSGETKLGGAIIDGDAVRFAFLVPPFADRALFWKLLLRKTGCARCLRSG